MADMQQKTIRGPVILGDIHSSGRCSGNLDHKNYYLDFGLPGEKVMFMMHRRKQGFRSGEVVEVVTPSQYRVDPFCMHHRDCGGCSWQHIKYAHQLTLKYEILSNALKRYGINTPEIPPVIPSPEIHYYRHRVEYTFASGIGSRSMNNKAKRQVSLGFHRYGEPTQVIDIRECFLQLQPSRSICEFIKSYALEHGLDFYDHEQKTGFLRSLSMRINRSGEVMLVIGFGEDRPSERGHLLKRLQQEFPTIVSLCWTVHPSPSHGQLQGEIIPFGNTDPYMYKIMAGNRFRIHASSFFQPNARQAENIFKVIRNWASLTGTENIYDLYTGIGTIAIFLAPGAKRVMGIEGSPLAVEDAKTNASINGIENVEFLTGDILETFKPNFLMKHGKPDIITLDPPRSGTLIEIKKTINTSGAGKVIYLSCNPVSLAFDLKQLTEAYQVTRIQPFDMLPHTHHLETLVLLEKK
jgi:23S rRNA (uracil1939-C5)-methyltransferase